MGVRERLREVMEIKGWNQARLTRALGEPDRHWVNNRVLGKSAIKADELPRLARALGVSCSAFFVGSECPEAVTAEEAALQRAAEGRVDYFANYVRNLTQGLPLPEAERKIIDGLLELRQRYQEGEESA